MGIRGQVGKSGAGAHNAVLWGCGDETTQYTDASAGKNFMNFYLANSSATGTTRGLYQRLYLSGGAGGECIRAYTIVSANAPVDTVNGIHTTLDFGASAGNVTGEGQAIRATLMVPSRTLGGTIAAVKAEIWANGTGSTVSNAAFIRCTLGGDGTGQATMQTSAKFMTIDGIGSAGSGKILQANSATASDHILKISVDGVAYGIMLVAL